MKNTLSKKSILVSLFAALICAGCFISIPLPGGVPVVVQDMLAMLSGLLLGPVLGSASVIVFMILGCIGLPVFSGKAGIQVLLNGPTCGFLWGYLASTFFAGLLLHIFLHPSKEHSNLKQWIVISLVAVLETIILFVLGIIGFRIVTGADMAKTLAAVVIPFIPGNAIKLVVMILLTKKFRPRIRAFLE